MAKSKQPGAGRRSSVVGVAAGAMSTATRFGLGLSLLPLKVAARLSGSTRMEDGLGRLTTNAAAFPRAMAEALESYAQDMESIGHASGAEDPIGIRSWRNDRQKTAIVMIHGFGMNSEMTWGQWPRFLVDDQRFADWDVFTIGYSTSMMLDMVGLWSASPPLGRLATLLETLLANSPFDRYENVSIVAHSMGGLIAQRALVDDGDLRARVGHFIMYGTPSGGLEKAKALAGWKRQIRDMAADSDFIRDLRSRWNEEIGSAPSFRFLAVAGDRDEFVPAESSLGPFEEAFRAVVPGDHATIASPGNVVDLNVAVLGRLLMGDAAPGGPWNSARLAVEERRFQAAVDQLWPLRAELDEQTKASLAVALDAVGRRDDAISVLEGQGLSETDQMGVLGGRYKRRWLLDRRAADADRARELYGEALRLSEQDEDHDQAYYHAINLAFLTLAHARDRSAARDLASLALDHCSRAEASSWKTATEAEGNLHLLRIDAAMASYRAVVEAAPQPWQLASTFQQAVVVAELLDRPDVAERLRILFRGQE